MARLEGTRRADGQYLPLVLVTIELRPTGVEPMTTSVLALVDSGADATTIPAELLGGSGIEFDDLPTEGRASQGIGGKVETRIAPGSISYDGVEFVEDAIQVIAPTALPGVVLGRVDFMTNFKVDFEWHKDPPVFHVKRPKYL